MQEQRLASYAQFNQQLLQAIMTSFSAGEPAAWTGIARSLMSGENQDSSEWLEIHERYYRRQWELCTRMLKSGEERRPVIEPEAADRRFRAPEWGEQPYFDYLKQSYLLYSRWLNEMAEASTLDSKAKSRLKFFLRQYIDSMAPGNFPATNPEVQKLAAETQGESLALGLRNLTRDIEKGRISMSDEDAFEVGRNLAITPGAVVFENELIQLIQYSPLSDQVYERPLLIVPPCISKFYVLDLQPESSFVRHCLEQNHTVFLISWRNAPVELGGIAWDDYLSEGVLAALDVALAITKADKANTLGFCVGGVLLACALALLAARDQRLASSMALLASMLDYELSGELGMLIDESFVLSREAQFKNGGVVHGKEINLIFSSLRANEFIWHYVINNYLKGKPPDAIDLLYWTGDQSNLPGAMYTYYIRNLYLENKLMRPGALSMCGTPVDLGSINVPTYVLAAREDHISPWKCAYASTRLLKGAVEFVLAAGGHVAGVINPPARNRRNYWVNQLADDPEQWLAAAESRAGSWWTHWSTWLKPRSGKLVPSRSKLGNDQYREIEPAPGRYVKVRDA